MMYRDFAAGKSDAHLAFRSFPRRRFSLWRHQQLRSEAAVVRRPNKLPLRGIDAGATRMRPAVIPEA